MSQLRQDRICRRPRRRSRKALPRLPLSSPRARKRRPTSISSFHESLRAGRAASKLKQAINVLNTFQIQQNGDQIRVVDADGSTYTGKIEPATQDAMRQAFKDKEGESLAARSERAQPQQDNSSQFYFRASGYNTSLKKPIVFEGNYIATPSQAQAPNESPTANQQQLPARIVGTAKVNGESPIEVDAVLYSAMKSARRGTETQRLPQTRAGRSGRLRRSIKKVMTPASSL